MTLPDVCGPVSPHIRILSLRLRERGMGWQSGHPTLLSVIQWEPWFESQRYILCGCSKHELAGWEAITATQPAIYQRNWGCRMGQHCSLWIELKQGLSRSDTPLRGQGVLLSTHTHTHTHNNTLNHVHMHTPPYRVERRLWTQPEPTQEIVLKEKVNLLNLSMKTLTEEKKSHTFENRQKKSQGHTHTDSCIHPHVCAHDTSAQTHMEERSKDKYYL